MQHCNVIPTAIIFHTLMRTAAFWRAHPISDPHDWSVNSNLCCDISGACDHKIQLQHVSCFGATKGNLAFATVSASNTGVRALSLFPPAARYFWWLTQFSKPSWSHALAWSRGLIHEPSALTRAIELLKLVVGHLERAFPSSSRAALGFGTKSKKQSLLLYKRNFMKFRWTNGPALFFACSWWKWWSLEATRSAAACMQCSFASFVVIVCHCIIVHFHFIVLHQQKNIKKILRGLAYVKHAQSCC